MRRDRQYESYDGLGLILEVFSVRPILKKYLRIVWDIIIE